MFDSITGTVVRIDPVGVVLAAGGIGYRLQAPLRTLRSLPESGEATLYSHLVVKDDALRLYGFQTPFERDLFLKIMSVSGIGAATALHLLSEITPEQFLDAVAREKIAVLQAVKGVGARTAKRLVLELKDKVEWAGLVPSEEGAAGLPQGALESNLGKDLVSALHALGYPRSAAREAASRALANHPELEDLESLLKAALGSM
jgi:Holliday junction DNA helicase RuvA